MKLNIKRIKSILLGFNVLASALAKDKNSLKKKVEESVTKAKNNQGVLAEVWHQLQTLFSLASDYATGKYTKVDRKTIVIIAGALLYFLSPVDFIPDFILGLGFIDDAFVIGYVYTKLIGEIEKYENWKGSKLISIHI